MPKSQFSVFNHNLPFAAKASRKAKPIYVVTSAQAEEFLKSLPKSERQNLDPKLWPQKPDIFVHSQDAEIDSVYAYVEEISLYTLSQAAEKIKAASPDFADEEFYLAETGLSADELNKLCIGWGLSAYQFDAYKNKSKGFAKLALPKLADKKIIEANIRAISLIRNLINLPANDLGPAELVAAAKVWAKNNQATIKVTEDAKLLTNNFPLIHAVGHGSSRRPALIDITWGNSKHPKVTLVGKGVVFDTGGYDIKPSSAMLLMKKDMGGSAMALGLAEMVASLNLPIRLRVLIPAVENSISGDAFRPGDIFASRKGLSVEIGNTDAEGRLVMADCLTLACEENPDLLIDFSTLTGAARVALGFDIPAIFSNDDALAQQLQKLSFGIEDPVWQLPLWQGYASDISSPNADINNAGNNPAGAITAALFLQSFVENSTNWIHIDHYAWEPNGKPGRPRGGADTGMRAVFQLLKDRYGKKSK